MVDGASTKWENVSNKSKKRADMDVKVEKCQDELAVGWNPFQSK